MCIGWTPSGQLASVTTRVTPVAEVVNVAVPVMVPPVSGVMLAAALGAAPASPSVLDASAFDPAEPPSVALPPDPPDPPALPPAPPLPAAPALPALPPCAAPPLPPFDVVLPPLPPEPAPPPLVVAALPPPPVAAAVLGLPDVSSELQDPSA